MVAKQHDGSNKEMVTSDEPTGAKTTAPNGNEYVKRDQERSGNLSRQLRDYATIGERLFWQRQMIFGVAILLAGYFYDLKMAILTVCIVFLNEVYDAISYRNILADQEMNQRAAKGHLHKIILGTVLSASTISFYAIWISVWQGQNTHFMPLFFLFAAGVFAAMNNHQIISVLSVRLTIYGITFIFIPVRDIFLSLDNVPSEHWVQLFSSLFVAFFIIDCSRIFLSMYRENLSKLEQLAEKNKRIESSLKAKSDFLSTMSHELRTPLTSIRASIDLVASGRSGETTDSTAKLMKISQKNCHALESLIGEILDFQKMEAGEMCFDTREVNIESSIARAVERNEPYAEEHGSRILFEASGEDVFGTVDEARIIQVLNNLLSNAAKFSPPNSKIQVWTSTRDNMTTIHVRDEGVGVNTEKGMNIFDPFTQLDSGDTRGQNGTGLGLSIAKRIVEAHGGEIYFENNPAGGATFSFSIPTYRNEARAVA